MATNQKFVKIQDIIDNINCEWGEEHEEKRKKIFNDNIFITPIFYFIVLSVIYLAPLAFSFPNLVSKSGKSEYFPIKFLELWFNFPYYIFDLRASIIVSIVSILLSLYVSVGKFADDAGGVVGEARRAAYRKFARVVGAIIFAAFTLNFWHGLLAGYFQGGASISYLFKSWVGSPEGGTGIVPEELNLSRYGEMPLWVLLLFAWFTLASALMLTYSEKDILIQCMRTLRMIKSLKNEENSYYVREYRLAENEFMYSDTESLYRLSENQVTKYGDLFLRRVNSVAFSFKFEYKKRKYLSISYGCTLVCAIILSICFQWEGALLGVLMISFEATGWLVALGFWMARSITRVDSFGMRFRMGKFLLKTCIWIIDNFSNILYAVIIVNSFFLPFQQQANFVICFIFLVSFLVGFTSRKIVVYNFKRSLKCNSKILLINTYLEVPSVSLSKKDIYVSEVGFCEWFRCVVCARVKSMPSVLFNSVKNSKNISPAKKNLQDGLVSVLHLRNSEIDYVALAYIYFNMVRVNEYYLEYKSLINKDAKKDAKNSYTFFFLKL